MSEQGEITVVIPTYNRMRLVARAIESVLNQTLQPCEVIVVDDGSSDRTADVCKAYVPRVRYVWQRNTGASASRNKGARLAKTRWIAFLDSDDYWTPSHLERIASAIRATNGEAAFYFSDMQMDDSDGGGTLWQLIGFRPQVPFHLLRDASAWMLMKRQPAMLQTSVINKQAMERVGGLSGRFQFMHHDTYLFCRLGIGGTACAVSGVGCVQTSDDYSTTRLTRSIPAASEENLMLACELWRDVLDREKSLPPNLRRLVTYTLARTHTGLGKAMWRSGCRAGAACNFLVAIKWDPRLAIWMLRKGTSKGYEQTIRPVCSEES
jgi:glycosyltransferase involved in cell wall biosynthesis